jgi:hypothetical protein
MCRATVAQMQDRRRLGELLYLTARLHAASGDHPAARENLSRAIDLFERLGMRREYAAGHALLTQLDGSRWA